MPDPVGSTVKTPSSCYVYWKDIATLTGDDVGDDVIHSFYETCYCDENEVSQKPNYQFFSSTYDHGWKKTNKECGPEEVGVIKSIRVPNELDIIKEAASACWSFMGRAGRSLYSMFFA